MEAALEAGAEDFKTEEAGYEIITSPATFESVHKQLELKGVKPISAVVTELPTVTTPIVEPADERALIRLIDALEEHDDVKEVYSNAEFSPSAS